MNNVAQFFFTGTVFMPWTWGWEVNRDAFFPLIAIHFLALFIGTLIWRYMKDTVSKRILTFIAAFVMLWQPVNTTVLFAASFMSYQGLSAWGAYPLAIFLAMVISALIFAVAKIAAGELVSVMTGLDNHA